VDTGLGHEPKLIAAKFVRPYRKNGKNDGNDAEAIYEAAGKPSMCFVPVRSIEQQTVLALHRMRQGYVVERTAVINRIRVLLTEFGMLLPQSRERVCRQTSSCAEGMPVLARRMIQELRSRLVMVGERIRAYDPEFATHARNRAIQCPRDRGKRR
jgi:transposase